MIPTTFPSTYETTNGETRMVVFFLSSVSGLTKWVDYIPVKFPMLETQDSNSNNNDGVVLVDPLSSTTNKQAWIDYIPVFVDDSDTAAWRVDANGYIPVGFAVKPTLNLDFAVTKTLDPRITFSRTSSATYYDANGVLQTAPAGVARFDHNPTTGESLGLLIEEQRTNLILQSEDFSTTWTNSNSSEETNVIVSPAGTLTGDKLIADTSNVAHFISQSNTFTVQPYTASVYFKQQSSGNYGFIRFVSGAIWTNSSGVVVDLSNGSIVSTNGLSASSVTNVGNGWYRVAITSTPNNAGTGAPFQIGVTTVSNITTVAYTGDGYSGIYIWGAQLEAGAFPTSYIPTTSASVTRNADVANMTGTNFSSWFRTDVGTLYAEAAPVLSGTNAVLAINDNSNNNAINMFWSTNAQFQIRTNNSTEAAISKAASSPFKLSGAYQTNNAAGTVNADTVTTDTSVILPVVNQLRIGQTGAGTNSTNGTIKKIAFYPARLLDAQLQALTTV